MSLAIAVDPPRIPSIISGTVRMLASYDSRIHKARAYPTFALDLSATVAEKAAMRRAQEILAALKRKLDAGEVTQSDIGRTLGITQPNVSMLWNPSSKTGKTRTLSYDEAVKLVETYRLFDDRELVNVEALQGLLRGLLLAAPRSGELSDGAARSLAVALRHGLASLPGHGATEPSDSDLAGAVRAAIALYREVAPA